jgi:hypothetical protein
MSVSDFVCLAGMALCGLTIVGVLATVHFFPSLYDEGGKWVRDTDHDGVRFMRWVPDETPSVEQNF